MDSRTISLVRTTFKAVVAQDGGPRKLAGSFYAILFSNYPDIRDLFPAAMDVQRDRIVAALDVVVARLEEPDVLRPYLAQLGHDHRKYGVLDAHYPAFGYSLREALRTFAGTEIWTDEVDAAWSEVLDFVAATMSAAARAAAEHTPALWTGTIVEHRRVLQNLAIVRLRLDEPMWYKPGQYVSVQVPARPRMWRYFSPAVPANDEGEIEFHVRGVAGGWVSPSIVGRSAVGDRWHFGAPGGELGIGSDDGRDILMVGSGTGVAPLRAQLLAMARRRDNPDVHLFVGGRYPCDLYDLDVLWRLARQHPWLTVTPVSEHDDNPWWHVDDVTSSPAGMHARLTGQLGRVVAGFGPWADRVVQICGPSAMVQTTKFRLLAAGVPMSCVRHDPLP